MCFGDSYVDYFLLYHCPSISLNIPVIKPQMLFLVSVMFIFKTFSYVFPILLYGVVQPAEHLPGIDFRPVGMFYKSCVSQTLSSQNITKRGAESAGSKVPVIYPQPPAGSGWAIVSGQGFSAASCGQRRKVCLHRLPGLLFWVLRSCLKALSPRPP